MMQIKLFCGLDTLCGKYLVPDMQQCSAQADRCTRGILLQCGSSGAGVFPSPKQTRPINMAAR
jgi:hypothetical protein